MSYEWYAPLARALARDGMSRADVGSVLRVSHKQVALALSAEDGIEPRPMKEIYLKDWQNGMTAAKIAEKHGVHASTVEVSLHRLRKEGREVQARARGRKRAAK